MELSLDAVAWPEEASLTTSCRAGLLCRPLRRSRRDRCGSQKLPNLCCLLVSSSSSPSYPLLRRRGAQCNRPHQVMGQDIPQDHRFSLSQTTDQEPLQATVASQGVHTLGRGGAL